MITRPRCSFLDMLQICCEFASAVLKRPLTFDEWNDVNKDVIRYRKSIKRKN